MKPYPFSAIVGHDRLRLALLLCAVRPEIGGALIRGEKGVAFGLYTMTGRAVSFLGPWLFSVFVDVFHTVRAGLGGVCLVLTTGLLLMLRVQVSRSGGCVRRSGLTAARSGSTCGCERSGPASAAERTSNV